MVRHPTDYVIYGAWRYDDEYVKPTTWDREPQIVDTGLLNVDGHPIKRVVNGMEPIGFVIPRDQQDESA